MDIPEPEWSCWCMSALLVQHRIPSHGAAVHTCMRHSLLAAATAAALLGLGGCTASRPVADPAMTAVADADGGCARPAVLVRNLTGSAVILYKSQGGQRSFVAEVPSGGAYQHSAEPATRYYLRSSRGLSAAADYAKPVTGMDQMARVERICTDRPGSMRTGER